MADLQPDARPSQWADAEAAEVLAALRRDGAERVDPVRLRYLEVLAQRMLTVPADVHAVLQGRWQEAGRDLAQRCRQAREAEPTPAAPSDPGGARHPLAELNRYIRGATMAAGAATASAVPESDTSELRSLREFRETWSRIAAVDQVDAATGRGPENAGPLNAHSLVLRSLSLMRSVSPDYLRRFLSQVETLMCLDDLAQRQREPVSKSKGKARPAPRRKPG